MNLLAQGGVYKDCGGAKKGKIATEKWQKKKHLNSLFCSKKA